MGAEHVCEAAREGRIEVIKNVIARKGILDGSDGDCYEGDVAGCIDGAPYQTPLGEAARYGHVEIVRMLLDAGVPVDLVDYRTETPLILAASWDQPASVDVLLERGANVNHVGCLGTALASVQPGWKKNAIDIAKKLLAAGASPTATASFTESAITKFTDRKPDKKVAKKHLELLYLLRPHAGDESARLEAFIAELEKSVGGATKAAAKQTSSLADLAKAQGKSWPADVRKAAGKIENEADRETLAQLCRTVLSTEAAVARPEWPALVRDITKMSKDYAFATKKSYGKSLPLSRLESDEGGAMDWFADEHLYTWDWVLSLLAMPAPRAHAEWADLVTELCEAKQKAVGYYSFGDEEIAALLEGSEPAQRDAVFAVAKKAFPYAPCFGGNGSLRDYVPSAAPNKAGPKKAPAKAAPKKAPAKAAPKKAPAKAAPKKGAPKKAPMKAAPKKK